MNPKQLNYTQQLEHRLAMIQDDLAVILKFIDDNGLRHDFSQPSSTSDMAYVNISNIQIACNLNDTESLSWTNYTNQKQTTCQ